MNRQTAQWLAGHGHQGICLPLSEIRDTDQPIPGDNYGGVIFTSQAAVDALANRPEDLRKLLAFDCPAYCVGEKTAASCRKTGFANVISANGNSSDLIELVTATEPNKSIRLLYLAGKERSGDLEGMLINRGYSVDLLEFYSAELIDPGGEVLADAFSATKNGCVFLYSSRTASYLFQLSEKYGLQPLFANIGLIAISNKVAQSVETYVGQTILIAETPSQTAMLDALNNYIKTKA